MAILRADAERLRAACLLREGRNQGRRRANQQVGLAGDSEAPASMASNSAAEAFRPFIFQLPAISGRMASVMSGFPGEYLVKHALAERGGQFQMPDLRSQSR